VERATLEAFRAGDPSAVRAVYDRYGGLVFAVTLRVLGDRMLAEEATQQTFVQAWRAAHSYDADRDLAPWLATIARRAAIDVHRREPDRSYTSLDDPDSSAELGRADLWRSNLGGFENAYEAWTVREAVEALPQEERDVVRLQHLEGFTHAEIAKALEIPLGTVKSRSNRAHKRLAGALGYLREVE
jgi:RNA polymerase sigma-70 factor (ECF subfamily)